MHIHTYIYMLAFVAMAACNSNNKESDSADNAAQAEPQTAATEEISPEKNLNDTGGSPRTAQLNFEKQAREGFERAARSFMESYRDGRFSEFVEFMHPAVVKAYGGSMAFINQLKKSKAQDPQRYRRWESGPLEAFTAVRDDRGRVTGYYSVVPIKRWLVGTTDAEYQLQWLGGQSLDGKNFHFVDITDGDKGMIYRIMPDMRYLLENLETEEVPEG